MNNKLPVVTIFLGSLISFALEPMVGRTLLPSFGGTPSVWVTCLAAYQLMMVAGYFYAGKARIKPHVVLIALAAIWCFYIGINRATILSAITGITAIPVLNVLLAVAILCGLTFVLLSANSSLVQLLSGGDYRLYAVSNAGSLIGLLVYPLLLEPYVAVSSQWHLLGGGMVVYALLLLAASRTCANAPKTATDTNGEAPTTSFVLPKFLPTKLLWWFIPAVSCALLNAVTAHLTLDVMPLPLLWAILLALFLISYIIGFSGKGERLITTWAVLAALSTAAAGASAALPAAFPHRFNYLLISDIAALLFSCTCLHSILYAIRPSGKELTKYYLLNVIGGAIGGLSTGIVAPLVFLCVSEHPLSVSLTAVCVVMLVRGRVRFATAFLALVSILGFSYAEFREVTDYRPVIYYGRGFFGTIAILDTPARTSTGTGHIHEFLHGNTVHGIQAFLPGKERMPTCYYTYGSTGYAIAGHHKYRSGEPMRVNVTGLGVGVLLSYARTNDYYRCYEISKDVYDVAHNTNLFTFVTGCPAKTEVVLQDARKGLEAELAAGVEPYDVIIVDAFTGDNLPYHLSSKEAFELYFKLLKPDGILCVNISNRFLELTPYVKKLGEEFNCPVLAMMTPPDPGHLGFKTQSAFLCRKPELMANPPIGNEPGKAIFIDLSQIKAMDRVPTDDCGSFVSLIKWR